MKLFWDGVPGLFLWTKHLYLSSLEGDDFADKTWTSVLSKFVFHTCPLLFSYIISVIKNCILRKLAIRVQGKKKYFYEPLATDFLSLFEDENVI